MAQSGQDMEKACSVKALVGDVSCLLLHTVHPLHTALHISVDSWCSNIAIVEPLLPKAQSTWRMPNPAVLIGVFPVDLLRRSATLCLFICA